MTNASPDSQTTSGSTTPTNVLVIMGDEHQRRALSCAGHLGVHTPNLDALAARGTRFTNCWTPSPICVPARGSFATGRWVHDIGVWHSAQPWYGEPEGWTHRARAAGCDVVSFGKLHHRSAADDDGFSERVRPMFVAGGIGWIQGLSRDDPIPFVEAAELAAQVGTGHTSYTRYDERVTADAAAWLENRDPGAPNPFAVFVSLVAPHYPLSAPYPWADVVGLDDIPPPEIGPVEPTNPAVAAMADLMPYHRYFDDAEHVQRARQAYFALVAWLDHNVGQVLKALERSGTLDDTLVIYTSDHGELAGNRGLWCKSYLYEDSVGVPLIVAGPGVPKGHVSSTPTNVVDIAPTIDRRLGTGETGGPGRDLVDLASSPDPDRINFSEYHDGGSVTGSFAISTAAWKYVEHVGYPPELFDRVEDPDELHDLGTDPRLAHERSELAEALRSICDPEARNAEAFRSQDALLARLGGRDAVANSEVRFNHTPVPID